MFNWIRNVLRREEPSSGSKNALDPELFVYVKIPGDVQPLVRGDKFEDPLDAALKAAGLGEVTGGGSQMDDPYPDGRPRVEFCGIDFAVLDRDASLALLRDWLLHLSAPEGTEIQYTVGSERLLDKLVLGTWSNRLPRTFMHPGFGV